MWYCCETMISPMWSLLACPPCMQVPAVVQESHVFGHVETAASMWFIDCSVHVVYRLQCPCDCFCIGRTELKQRARLDKHKQGIKWETKWDFSPFL